MEKKNSKKLKKLGTNFGKVKNDYFSRREPAETSALTFVRILHHNNMGAIIRMDKARNPEPGGSGIRQVASKDTMVIADFASLVNTEYFVTLNEFYGYSRVSNKCSAIGCLYVDLDGHDLSHDQLNKAVMRTEQRLNEAWNEGEMLPPTCITLTGRGIGLYYVLQNSIAVQTQKSERLLKFYDWIYGMLICAYQNLLSGDGYLQVDKATRDKARVVRLPGSYNVAANTVCRLCKVPLNIDGNPYYYTLDHIKAGCKLEQYACAGHDRDFSAFRRSILKKQKKYEDIFQGNSDWNKRLHMHRINWLIKVAHTKQEQCNEGYRDEVLHLLYNAAVQVMSYGEAESLIREINASFVKPLKDREIMSIIGTIRRHGIYRYTTQKMIDKLNLTWDEVEQCGCRIATRDRERDQKREKKQERNEMIISLRRNHPEYSRQDILSELSKLGYNCSMRTLDRIISANGLNYYNLELKGEKTKNNCGRTDGMKETAKNDDVCYFFPREQNSPKSSYVTFAKSFVNSLYVWHGDNEGCVKMLDAFVYELDKTESLLQQRAYKALACIANLYRNKLEYQLVRYVFSDLDSIYQGLQSGQMKPTFCGKEIAFDDLDREEYPDTFEYDWKENWSKKGNKVKTNNNDISRICTPCQKKVIHIYERVMDFIDFLDENQHAKAIMHQVASALKTSVKEPYYDMYRTGMINFLNLTKTQWKSLVSKMSGILTPDMKAHEVLIVFEQVICKHFKLTSLTSFQVRKKKYRMTEKQRLAMERKNNAKAMWETLFYIKRTEVKAADFCEAFLRVYRQYKDAKDETRRTIKAEFNALLPQDIRLLADSVYNTSFEKKTVLDNYILKNVIDIGSRRNRNVSSMDLKKIS